MVTNQGLFTSLMNTLGCFYTMEFYATMLNLAIMALKRVMLLHQ